MILDKPKNILSADQRACIAAGTDSVRAAARRLGVNPKTVQRWRQRATTLDRPGGRPKGAGTCLSREEQAMVVSFRQVTMLPLDDCLYALQPVIPHLRRSTLHRCLLRHGLSRLPPQLGARSGFIGAPGQIVIFVTEAPTETGLCHLFAATDRATRFVVATLSPAANAAAATEFLGQLCAALPFRIDTVIACQHKCFSAPQAGDDFRLACRQRGIGYRTVPSQIAAGGAARADSWKYASPQDLAQKLGMFIAAVNDRQRLKTLGGITPREAVIRAWRAAPWRFLRDPGDRKVVLF